MPDYVPPRFLPGFVVLRDLSAEDAERFAAGLQDAPSFLGLSKLGDAVHELLPSVSAEDANEVANSLLSLRAQVRSRSAEDAQEVAEMAAHSDSLDVAEPDDFAALLTRVLTAEALATTADAADMLVQHERPFRSARIFTDIRPVFTEDPTSTPQGAVIAETLSIDYWTRTGDRATVTFGLDELDLIALKEVVDRAITKTDTLKAFLSGTGLSVLDITGGEKHP